MTRYIVEIDVDGYDNEKEMHHGEVAMLHSLRGCAWETRVIKRLPDNYRALLKNVAITLEQSADLLQDQDIDDECEGVRDMAMEVRQLLKVMKR